MKCCHVSPNGPFTASLANDARRFSAYVGGSVALPHRAPGSDLVSALHIDLKLWDPPKKIPIGTPYRPNDAIGNSWKVARPRRAKDPFRSQALSRQAVRNLVTALNLPGTTSCVLGVFDHWLLTTICTVRATAIGVRGFVIQPRPSALSTIGMAQKLINVFWKYQVCWHAGGLWNPAIGAFAVPQSAAVVAPFLCAFHSPIDSILLERIKDELPFGKWLLKQKLMDHSACLRESGGVYTPWSKLESLDTYYGFQLMLRRIAMHSWPSGCGCGKGTASRCALDSVVGGPQRPSRNKRPWMDAVDRLPLEVIEATLEAISKLSTGRGEPGDPYSVEQRGGGASSDNGRHNRSSRKESIKTKESLSIDPPSISKTSVALAEEGRRRNVMVKRQQVFKSLKWACGDRWNAGALSFNQTGYVGQCHVNSREYHAGGDRTLAEQIALNGFDFFGAGFNPAPAHGGVAGLGAGVGFAGYRSFKDETAARAYLVSVGLDPINC